MVSKIGKQLYYFYFVDNKNDIKEGFLIFGNLDIQSIYSIIIDFQTSDVNLFLNNYFDSKPTFNDKFIIYHRNEFDLLIKNNNYNSLKKYNLKKIHQQSWVMNSLLVSFLTFSNSSSHLSI